MIGKLFKKKQPSYFLVQQPNTVVFTLPAKFSSHEVMNPVFTSEEQKALYKLFKGNGRRVSSLIHEDRSEIFEGGEYLCFAQFVNCGEIFWSEFDDLTSVIYGQGPGHVVKNPKGLIQVREFEFFVDGKHLDNDFEKNSKQSIESDIENKEYLARGNSGGPKNASFEALESSRDPVENKLDKSDVNFRNKMVKCPLCRSINSLTERQIRKKQIFHPLCSVCRGELPI